MYLEKKKLRSWTTPSPRFRVCKESGKIPSLPLPSEFFKSFFFSKKWKLEVAWTLEKEIRVEFNIRNIFSFSQKEELYFDKKRILIDSIKKVLFSRMSVSFHKDTHQWWLINIHIRLYHRFFFFFFSTYYRHLLPNKDYKETLFWTPYALLSLNSWYLIIDIKTRHVEQDRGRAQQNLSYRILLPGRSQESDRQLKYRVPPHKYRVSPKKMELVFILLYTPCIPCSYSCVLYTPLHYYHVLVSGIY